MAYSIFWEKYYYISVLPELSYPILNTVSYFFNKRRSFTWGTMRKETKRRQKITQQKKIASAFVFLFFVPAPTYLRLQGNHLLGPSIKRVGSGW